MDISTTSSGTCSLSKSSSRANYDLSSALRASLTQSIWIWNFILLILQVGPVGTASNVFSTIYLMLSFPTLCYDVTIQGYSIWCSPILLSKQPIKVKHMHYQNYWNMGILNTMIDQCEQNLVECWTICWEDTPLQTFLLPRYQSWAPTYCAILYW